MSKLSDLLRSACNVALFTGHGYDPKVNAQRNLSGRTHYVDDDTLKFFHSRVVYAAAECDGAVFVIITSEALDHENRTRGFRYVAFDVFGTVIERTESDRAYKTSNTARKALGEFLASFYVDSYYIGVLSDRANRLSREALACRDAARAIVGS